MKIISIYLKIIFPKNFSLKGLKIAIDCANGAGYKSGPKILKLLGAKVYSIGTSPNGLNINSNFGSSRNISFLKYVLKRTRPRRSAFYF